MSKLSTLTVAASGDLVPWLAADGPLAYHPEDPPADDYYFQYGWVLPDVLSERVNRRRHYIFGAQRKEDAAELMAFWRDARTKIPDRVVHSVGTIRSDAVTAPLAVYRVPRGRRGPALLLVQHGSYQIVDIADQPLLDAGEAVLYRGLQDSKEFRVARLDAIDDVSHQAWLNYFAVQAHVLSDAVRSFNSIHDRAKRTETGHIRDGSWITDDIARRHGFDIDGAGFPGRLWGAAHQSFSLARWVAANKFGPRYVVCKTPLGNIRMTTFFAGEHEVRIIDPRRVEVLETHGCRVAPLPRK